MSTHKELLTSGKFDEKVKKTLLDYYSYGFKKEKDLHPSKKTIADDWERLNNIISDYLEWSSFEDKSETMFASVDSQSMEENPFHRVYRFCKYNPLTIPSFFFHLIASLSSQIKLNQEYKSKSTKQNRNSIGLRKDTLTYKTSELLQMIPIIDENENKRNNNRVNNGILSIINKAIGIENDNYPNVHLKKLSFTYGHSTISYDLFNEVRDGVKKEEKEFEAIPTRIEVIDNVKYLLCDEKFIRTNDKDATKNKKKTTSKKDREKLIAFRLDYLELISTESEKTLINDINHVISYNNQKPNDKPLLTIRFNYFLSPLPFDYLLKCQKKKEKEKRYIVTPYYTELVDGKAYLLASYWKDLPANKKKEKSSNKNNKNRKFQLRVFRIDYITNIQMQNNSGDRYEVACDRNFNLTDRCRKFIKSNNIESKKFLERIDSLTGLGCIRFVNRIVEQKNGDDLFWMEVDSALEELNLNKSKSYDNFEKEFYSLLLHKIFSEVLSTQRQNNQVKTYNDRLSALSGLGLVVCNQNEGKKYKIAGKQRIAKTDRFWSLNRLTMKDIINEGKRVNVLFENNFQLMIKFFSEYYLFGEVGTFLCDRCGENLESPFRFKHNYFMQSINDFNIIDLLYAIENKKWCKIKYSHGTAGFSTELLCYPLEIRVSSMNGRQHLMFYEPFHRSYTALRIEFIDSIEFYDDEIIKTILVQNGYFFLSEIVDNDISNSKKSLQYSWGVSTTKKQSGNAVEPVIPHTVSMVIQFDPQNEKYINNRVYRERRSGNVDDLDKRNSKSYSVTVSDEVEMRPWVRSFYSRLLSCNGMDSGGFSIESDVFKFDSQCLRVKSKTHEKVSNAKMEQKWGIPQKVNKKLKNGIIAREHELIFNEVFGIYYYIIADVFVQICSRDYINALDDLDIIIDESINKFFNRIGEKTWDIAPSEIKQLMIDGGFLKREEKIVNNKGCFFNEKTKSFVYIPIYKCSSEIALYRDIIPLTTIELRWIKTILFNETQKVRMFLSDSEIDVLKNLLKRVSKIDPFPMEKVKYYDRFFFPEHSAKKEVEILPEIIKGICQKKTMFIKYRAKKRMITGKFNPILIEYSKRNNRFQAFFQKCGSESIYTMNVSQIRKVDNKKTGFDFAKAKEIFVKYRKESTTSVEIEFYDDHNLADRILTEFSPWKKQCSFDSKTEIYRLKIYYLKEDEIDLVVRFLGYVTDLRFVDYEHPICKEIKTRMEQQKNLIFERQHNIDDKEVGESR